MGALDRYHERQKKKESTFANNTVKGNALDRYYDHQRYRETDTDLVDQKYIDSLINDSKAFISTAEKDYGELEWGNASSIYESKNSTWQELNTRADTINAWLYKNRKRLNSQTDFRRNNGPPGGSNRCPGRSFRPTAGKWRCSSGRSAVRRPRRYSRKRHPLRTRYRLPLVR